MIPFFDSSKMRQLQRQARSKPVDSRSQALPASSFGPGPPGPASMTGGSYEAEPRRNDAPRQCLGARSICFGSLSPRLHPRRHHGPVQRAALPYHPLPLRPCL